MVPPGRWLSNSVAEYSVAEDSATRLRLYAAAGSADFQIAEQHRGCLGDLGNRSVEHLQVVRRRAGEPAHLAYVLACGFFDLGLAGRDGPITQTFD